MLYDKNAPERAVTLSVNSDLAAKAKTLGVNLSEALEGRLAELLAAHDRQKWREENAAAIESYNDRVLKGQILSDFDRLF